LNNFLQIKNPKSKAAKFFSFFDHFPRYSGFLLQKRRKIAFLVPAAAISIIGFL